MNVDTTAIRPMTEEEKNRIRGKEITEKVNHPSHYNREGAMECIDEMLLFFTKEEVLSFCKLNAYKYRYRAADKNGKEDLKKSDWYVQKYKEIKDKINKIDNNVNPWQE